MNDITNAQAAAIQAAATILSANLTPIDNRTIPQRVADLAEQILYEVESRQKMAANMFTIARPHN